jgi:phage repressor protein C with HTH and peptisase S24 domain
LHTVINMDRPLKDIVKDRMDKLGINVLALSRQTGIPSSRIYKWYPKNPDEAKKANPKYPDIQILQEWMNMSDEEILKLEQVESNGNRESLGPSYREQLWLGKVLPTENYFPLIPHKARAGYSRNYEDVDYVKENFEQYPSPPGAPSTKGTDWRWFEVGGDSMVPVLNEGDYLFCNLLPHADWVDSIRSEPYKVYVIVHNNDVSVKRIAIDKGDYILISENEEYGQKRVQIKDVKEIWKVRRRITAQMPPTKRFKIIV